MSWMSLVGVSGLVSKVNALEKAYQNKLEAAVISGALLVMNSAKSKCPWKTGNLRSSVHIGSEGTGLNSPTKTEGTDIGGKVVEGTRVRVDVGTNVVYAPYVEYGTSRMGAQPYLRPALDENRDKVAKEIEKAMSLLS